jgi:hypothetical protein
MPVAAPDRDPAYEYISGGISATYTRRVPVGQALNATRE